MMVNFDLVSYEENVTRLIQLVAKNGSKSSILVLFKLTFQGRRKAVIEGHYSDIYDFMKKYCSVLNEVHFLHSEFELMLEKGICMRLVDRWTEFVPLILRVAKKRASSCKISKLIEHYKNSDIRNSFGKYTKACAALQFLHALLPVNNKKNVNAIDYIYFAKEESGCLETTLDDTKGRRPFILHFEEKTIVGKRDSKTDSAAISILVKDLEKPFPILKDPQLSIQLPLCNSYKL
ncbi:hypothetical protein OUZ56_012039 [Daphnia magna]|uniref:Uncharacterized protein n=1 Tax=Daphnia magna TaxID=35525 RepID=A0ABQ9Z1W3_9CRUS|nr:hypothetical protein OUZ56_012039 [Daphnia magna]